MKTVRDKKKYNKREAYFIIIFIEIYF
jgi:hypothetical protein